MGNVASAPETFVEGFSTKEVAAVVAEESSCTSTLSRVIEEPSNCAPLKLMIRASAVELQFASVRVAVCGIGVVGSA